MIAYLPLGDKNNTTLRDKSQGSRFILSISSIRYHRTLHLRNVIAAIVMFLGNHFSNINMLLLEGLMGQLTLLRSMVSLDTVA